MKVLKIILFLFLGLMVVSTAGLYIFLRTFDVNKFLPQISQQATRAIGRDLHIGRAQLGFSLLNGIGLQINDVVLADDPKFADKPFLSVDRIDVGLNIGALILERKIQLGQLVIVSPKVVIIRSKEGLVNAATIGAQPAAAVDAPVAASSAQGVSASGLPAFLVNDIRILGAKITYMDETFTPHLAIQVDRMDINIHDFSLSGPFHVVIKAALFSAEQDVTADVRVALDLVKQSAHLTQMNVEADLAKVDAARLENELSMLKSLSLKKLDGVFKFTASDVEAGVQGLVRLKGQAFMDKGFILSALIPVPVENIELRADVDEKKIDVKTLSRTVAEGTVNGTALVSNYLTRPSVVVTFEAQGINAKKLVEGYKTPVSMSGVISAAGDMTFSGKSPEEIMASLNGKVKAELKDGILENMNLLAAGLGNIPMLPGLLESVSADLPPETQDEIKKGITRFETCKAEAHIVNGLMQVDMADMTTRDLSVHATGTVKLVQDVSIKADIHLAPSLSERLAERVKELSYLKDEDGRIYLPMTLTGPVMKPVFMPELKYLTNKLVVAVGGDQLQKALGGSPAAAEAVGAIFDLSRKK